MKKNITHLSFFVFLFLLFSFSNSLKAQIVLEAKDNVFVKGGVASDSNYYSDPSYLLRVRGSAGDDNKRRTYIKFDLHTVTQAFSKAELRITINRVVAITGGLINRSDIFTVTNDSWSEQTLTWNTAPPRNTYLFTQEYATKTSTMADTVYSLDLTNYVQSEYNGDKVVSICMVDTLNNGTDVRFWSNRSLLATGPQLVLTTGPVGNINITSPAGGENWSVGSTNNITWSSTNITNMKIDYSINNGASWVNITPSTPASAGAYSWNIPPTNSSTQCKIRLSDADNIFTSNVSAGVFTILNNTALVNVVSPASGDKLIVGSTHNISWTSSYVTNVKLEYSGDNGSSWNSIVASKSASSLVYPWTIPSTPSGQCIVRISDVVNSAVSGVSPVFSILSAVQNSGTLLADVFVKAGVSADSNYATDVLLRVRGSATVDNQRKTYLKFDINSFAGTQIDRAELKVTAYQVIANSSGPNRMDVFTVPNDNWTESAITWNNAPVKGDYISTQEFGTKATTQPDTTYPVDVTAYVKNEFAGDKIVSFCLTDTSNNNTDIRLGSSRGFVQAPQLILYTITGINDKYTNIPNVFSVNQNYPNPFNPSTKISYSIPSSGLVKVTIYDILGNIVTVLANEVQKAGRHDLVWNASSLSSGVYFYRIQYADYNTTNKMILMK